MATRTALFICCSASEAKTIRQQAKADRRTVSGYVLFVIFRTLPLEERIFMVQNYQRARPRSIGPRTAVLVRCSTEEANRIRATARKSGTTLSAYVLTHLARWWKVGSVPLTKMR